MYRVIIANTKNSVTSATTASRLEKEYNQIRRQLEEYNWEYNTASREGLPTPPDDGIDALEERLCEVHDMLFDMWKNIPNSVSKALEIQFAEEEKSDQYLW